MIRSALQRIAFEIRFAVFGARMAAHAALYGNEDVNGDRT